VQQSDRITPRDASISTYLDDLKNRQYQIPTFQREVVWEKKAIKKLWDSIFRFYPIGSILVWKTDVKLEKHRRIGGHDIADPARETGFNYIIDGQQRTTALLTSLFGVDGEWAGDFDPALYVDLTVEEAEDVDEANFNERFLFWEEIDDRDGALSRNTPRMERYEEGYIVKLERILNEVWEIDGNLDQMGHEYNDPLRNRLREYQNVLQNYRIPFIELRGIEIQEVTEIFERVNQEGEPLDIFDIVVAKTFRPQEGNDDGFYLREMIEDFRDETGGQFVSISNKRYLEMLAMIIKYHVDGNNVNNITDTFLNNIQTEEIEEVWPDAKEAFRDTFDFFENHLHIKGPNLIPFRYFYITISFYFYNNDDPDYDLLTKYFWFYSFHTENLLRHTQHLRDRHLDWLYRAKNGEDVEFDRFLLDRDDLRSASYSYTGRFSRAILSFLSYHEPKDWKHYDRSVLTEVYYQLRHEPNLHHIFPRNFVENYPEQDEYDEDSLMNIAFLPQITNLEISDRNPVEYLKDYDDDDGFEKVLQTHLIPEKVLDWSRDEEIGYGTLDDFISMRVDYFVDEISEQLSGVQFDVIDSQVQETSVRVLVEDGETETTEFKSTLRTDVKERGTPERVIEQQCLKAINGFLNSPDGGTLLIGVKDDGSIHGLEDDYATFDEEQKQEVFKRHLHNLIRSNMEDKFNDFVTISFATVNNKDVCLVEVEHANTPAYLESEGDQKFYTRRGNRTIPLEPKDQNEYTNQFF
jgi:hypothetical protein